MMTANAKMQHDGGGLLGRACRRCCRAGGLSRRGKLPMSQHKNKMNCLTFGDLKRLVAVRPRMCVSVALAKCED